MTDNRLRAELFTGSDGQWYFRIKAANGEIVSTSEAYERFSSAEHAALLIVEEDRIERVDE